MRGRLAVDVNISLTLDLHLLALEEYPHTILPCLDPECPAHIAEVFGQINKGGHSWNFRCSYRGTYLNTWTITRDYFQEVPPPIIRCFSMPKSIVPTKLLWEVTVWAFWDFRRISRSSPSSLWLWCWRLSQSLHSFTFPLSKWTEFVS